MKLVEEYLRRAEDSKKLARQADIPDHCKSIQRIGETWSRLAAERLKRLQNGRPKTRDA